MKKKTFGLVACLAVAVLIASPVGCRGCGSVDKSSPPGNTAVQDRIRTMTPKRRNFPILSPWFGKVESTEAISLVALEPGRIVSVDAPDETAVAKGALLFTLGGPRIRAQSKTLRAKIASLHKQVDLAGRAVAMKQVAVSQKMAKKEELLSAKDALSRLRSALTAAEEEFSSLQQRLRVRAPRNGVVTGRRVSVGQEVEKGDLLAELIPPNSLRIVATLFPPENAPLSALEAVVETPAGKAVYARVAKVRPVRTREGATVIWLEGDAVNCSFAPGESVSGHVVLSLHKNALALPESAVVRDERERTFVFLKTGSDYQRQAVETGEIADGWVEILKGVGEKDPVVVRGAYELFYRNFNRIYKVED